MKKRIACSKCGKKRITTYHDINLAPYICQECWIKLGGVLPIKYETAGGEAEIISFRAVTQEKNAQYCCNNHKCGQDIHSVGDTVIFLDCKVRDINGVRKWGSYFIIPPEKYWCPFGR